MIWTCSSNQALGQDQMLITYLLIHGILRRALTRTVRGKNPTKRIKGSKLRSSYPCAGAQGVRRAEFPLRTLGSQPSLADSLTALLHGETTVSPTPFADPPFIPA